MSFNNAGSSAGNSRNVLDLHSFKCHMRQLILTRKRELTRQLEEELKAKRRKRRQAMIKRRQRKRLELARAKHHQIITRSKLRQLATDQKDISRAERLALVCILNKLKCRICKQLKELTCFYRFKQTALGYHNTCISCENERFNENFAQDKRIFKIHWMRARDRAKLKDWDFDLAPEDLELLFEKQNGRCAYTGRELVLAKKRDYEHRGEYFVRTRTGAFHDMYRASLDRIDPKRGYTRDNVHYVCLHINLLKLDLTDTEFTDICRDVTRISEERGPARPPLLQ